MLIITPGIFEISKLIGQSSSEIISHTKLIFTRHRVPQEMVFDNGLNMDSPITSYYILLSKSFECSSWDQKLINFSGIDTQPLFVVCLVLSVGTADSSWSVCTGLEWLFPESRIWVKCCLFLHSSLQLGLQYDYNLRDCDCLAITPLSLLPDIHTCCPGSNGSRLFATWHTFWC